MILLLAAAPALLAVDIPEQRRFGDWLAVCDNVRRCEAIALPREEGPERQVTLSVARNGDSGAVPALEATGIFGEVLPKGRWRIDGRYSAMSGLPLVRALARSRRAEWVLPSGRVYGPLHVAGASAALRWIDDQQHRAGGVTAMVAIGPRPASAIPAPPVAPRLVAPAIPKLAPKVPGAAAIKSFRDKADCDVESAPDYHRLDAGHSLALIPCNLGAYQGLSLMMIGDEQGRWSPAPIEWPKRLLNDGQDGWAAALVMSAEFADGALASFNKDRGLGDCGHSASWVWDGRVFRLARYAGLDVCAGSRAWPSMWQSANAPHE